MAKFRVKWDGTIMHQKSKTIVIPFYYLYTKKRDTPHQSGMLNFYPKEEKRSQNDKEMKKHFLN